MPSDLNPVHCVFADCDKGFASPLEAIRHLQEVHQLAQQPIRQRWKRPCRKQPPSDSTEEEVPSGDETISDEAVGEELRRMDDSLASGAMDASVSCSVDDKRPGSLDRRGTENTIDSTPSLGAKCPMFNDLHGKLRSPKMRESKGDDSAEIGSPYYADDTSCSPLYLPEKRSEPISARLLVNPVHSGASSQPESVKGCDRLSGQFLSGPSEGRKSTYNELTRCHRCLANKRKNESRVDPAPRQPRDLDLTGTCSTGFCKVLDWRGHTNLDGFALENRTTSPLVQQGSKILTNESGTSGTPKRREDTGAKRPGASGKTQASVPGVSAAPPVSMRLVRVEKEHKHASARGSSPGAVSGDSSTWVELRRLRSDVLRLHQVKSRLCEDRDRLRRENRSLRRVADSSKAQIHGLQRDIQELRDSSRALGANGIRMANILYHIHQVTAPPPRASSV